MMQLENPNGNNCIVLFLALLTFNPFKYGNHPKNILSLLLITKIILFYKFAFFQNS